MDFSRWRIREDQVVLLALIFLAFFFSADAGNALRVVTAPTLIWPAAGIALTAVLLAGDAALIPIGLAAFVFEFFVGHFALVPAAVLALANIAQPYLAARTLRQLSFDTRLGRLQDASMLIAVSVGAATVVPTLGSLVLYGYGLLPLAKLSAVWGSWYVGELFSFLALTPVLVRWLPRVALHRKRTEWIEILSALASVVVLSVLIFWTPYGIVDGVPLIYVLLLPLIWISLRMGPRILTLGLAFMSGVALAGTIARATPAMLGDSLFSIELLLSILTVIFLLLVSLAEERKQATDALRKQLLRLEDALEKIRGEDRAKGDFLAVLAHELRNPLAPLLSSLELLRLTADTDPKMRETVNAMRGRVRTMARLLDDLLDVTRVTHGKLVLRKEPVDLVRIAKRAAETVDAEMAAHHHAFSTDLPGKPIETYADPLRIEQVVVNLLNNAAKYSEDGGKISLTLRSQNKEAVFTVRDTGVGIDPAMAERIFEPFRQGEPAQRMSRGLGIGLALSKNLVELHEGRIEAKSAGVGRGSEFIVRLPLMKAPRGATASSEKSRQIKHISAASAALSILIVDDNRAAADALLALLTHVGHTAEAVYDGASGIARAKSLAPDVIILDIGLPDIEGYEVARQLKGNGSRATLIALTGYGQKEDKEKALEAGFDHHLTKPIGLVDIEAVLRTIKPPKK